MYHIQVLYLPLHLFFIKFIIADRSYYDELIEQGVLVPLKHKILGQRPNKGGTEDFVTPRGSASLVSHYFSKSNTQVEFEHTVSSLRCDDNESKWQVETNVG